MLPEEKDILAEDQVSDEDSFVDDLGMGEEGAKPAPKEEKPEETKEPEGEEEESEEEEASTKEDEEGEEEPELKDLSEEEIAKLPKDAKGLYYHLKKEQGKRKEIEAELQFLRLQKKYTKPVTEKKEEETDEEFETVEDIIKDKADDDLLTAGEMRRIRQAEEKQRLSRENKTKAQQDKVTKERQAKIAELDAQEEAFKSAHSDYGEMFSAFQEAAKEIPALMLEVRAEIERENGNPAKKVYELGKKFKGVYGKTDDGKPKDVKRILKNAAKKPSSASIAGSSVSEEALDEMDAEELGKTLSSMSMAQFAKVPKKIRLKAMRGY